MHTGEAEAARLWEIALEFIYDKHNYICGLDVLLRKHGARKILDCSCGIGFPAIGLIGLGYDVFCTDGSSEMIRIARQNASKAGLELRAEVIKWNKLAERFGSEFDAVLCRGNSLPYATSWGGANTTPQKSEILKAIENFYAVLKPNGILYADAAPPQHFGVLRAESTEDFRERVITGRTVNFRWRVCNDLASRERLWSPEASIMRTGTCIEKIAIMEKGYLLGHDELVEMMWNAGFAPVEKYVEVAGEENYDVFIAHKKECDRHESNVDTAGA